MDHFRQQSTYGHLPNFGMLFEKNLYLPNTTNVPIMYPILGVWNGEWDTTHKNVLVGVVQQDTDSNIYFLITACYQMAQCSFHDWSNATLVPKHIFADYWPTQYLFDPLLSVVQLFMADFYVVSAPLPPPPPPAPIAATAAAAEPECCYVCKTEKPDVYHVYLQGQHVSSCLIPNIKISKFMYDFFEHKNLYQLVAMKNLTLHEKSGKYIPYL
jgi:hypothetical protein